ncbi:MAG TPA: UDP-glucose/GDP-mannose dehydrogenase family protein, partial [Candidatus Saccharimonadales bacterium]|nr:UDP-glucose/GDP-mannose dehydrogenase family protein [Candidatus Saccharimonadales bacterium]
MKLCVIGTGYVGLVGAAVFSEWGNEVVGVDIDEKKIKRIQNGDMPIYEPGLAELVLKNIKDKRLKFTSSLKEGIKDAEIVFVCVGTPQGDTGAADLTAVLGVAKEIGQNLTDYKVVVTKSTVPVGTNEQVKKIIREVAGKNAKFDVASNPEFLREGSSIEDMMNTDRTVVGTDSERAMKVMKKLYSHLASPIVECDLRSAEMVKYASNAFLATKISFINEIGTLCERAGADVTKVAKGMGLDKRIGSRFLNASIGYGGSCFPKDVAALYKTSSDQAYDFKLLRAVMEVNELQRKNFVKKVYKTFGENLSGMTLAILGLAFKNNTDDVRESVAIKIVKLLRGSGVKLRVFDPAAMENAKKTLGDELVYYAKDEYDAIKGSDALCILTEWDQFKELDVAKLKKMLAKKVIFDGRNLLDQKQVEAAGLIYFAIGKRTNGYNEETISSALLKN